MNIIVPGKLEREFREDYHSWCMSEGLLDTLISSDATFNNVKLDLMKTTNCSTQSITPVAKTMFSDVNNTFDNFLRKYQKWSSFIAN